MNDQIVTIADIQRRARAAFDKGLPASSCAFNWHTAAYATWHQEYARLEAASTIKHAQHQEQRA